MLTYVIATRHQNLFATCTVYRIPELRKAPLVGRKCGG